MEKRDLWLREDDNQLSAECVLEFFKGSGSGGQKRNKTSSAVRVRHLPSGLTAEDCSERSQHLNRRNALNKLRFKIAFNFRCAPSELIRPEVAMTHADYPLWCAVLLDHLAEKDWAPAGAAKSLGFTSSKLVKYLYRDPALWQFVNSKRRIPLKTP
ncbi:MAG: peptide chain release factor-like protein [Victivallaceae bacterium]|nr:peptide chain release factor-like protein [Victivallaceae bacterium]